MKWWIGFNFEVNQRRKWDFGSFVVEIQRTIDEWLLCPSYPEVESDPQDCEMSDSLQSDYLSGDYLRAIYTNKKNKILISPALPDRNLVAKPVRPISLLPTQEVTLFVGATLWFMARTEDSNHILLDVPLKKLSDTWCGPSPRQGELCYSSRTHAFIDSSSMPLKTNRAVVPVKIKNETSEPLKIEKLNIPIPFLSLFVDNKGQFWTNSIQLIKESSKSEVSIRVDSETNYVSKTKNLTLVSQARRADQSKLITKAYNMLFS